MSTLSKYLDDTGHLPADVVLGRVVMVTITDEPVAHADVSKWFMQNHLNSSFLPPPIKAVNAFKKATTQVDGEKYDLGGGLTASVLTRDVSSTDDFICRHIVREVKDSANRRLAFDKTIECYFYRAKNGVAGTERFRMTIDNDPLRPGERDRMDGLIKDIQARYNRYVNYLDGQALRAIVRNYLKFLNGIEIQGGTYFVHSSRNNELQALKRVVELMGGGCRMHLIPLVNLDSERQMVIDAFQRDASSALMDIVVEINRVKATRATFTPAMYAKIRDKYDTVMKQAQEHLRTLGASQDLTASAAELALDALVEVQTSVLNGGGK
jgi:hypothetical protein